MAVTETSTSVQRPESLGVVEAGYVWTRPFVGGFFSFPCRTFYAQAMEMNR